jgi:aminoglycoside phosphotransferase (APT) family kinase protein
MATGDAPRQAWFALGQQLSLVHAVIPETEVPVPLREFRQSAAVDPQPWVTELLAAGSLTSDDAMWLRRLLEDLAPVALAGNEADRLLRLCHGDVNASNVLVASDTGAFRAVIDWAGAGWLDPVWDFAGIPLDAVPWVLAGHRAVAPLPDDATAEVRICWCQSQTRLFAARALPDAGATREQLRRDLDGLRAFVTAADLNQ